MGDTVISGAPIKSYDFADSDADLVYTHDFAGAILTIHGSVERITGYSREEALRMSLHELFDSKYVEQTLQDVMVQMGGGAPAPRRFALKTKSGKRKQLETYSRILFDRGRPVAVEGLVWDVRGSGPERARSRDAALEHRLERYSAHLKHLHRLNVRKYGTLEDVFDDFLKTGCEIFKLRTGLIHTVEGGKPQIHASLALPRDFSMEGEQGTAGMQLGSFLGTPILVDGNLYGRLSFFSEGGPQRRFTPQEREVVELMGRSLGRVILEHRVHAETGRTTTLEKDRNELLEMIAANYPIEATLTHLARMIDRQSPSGRSAAILMEKGAVSFVAAPGLPRHYARIVRELEPGSAPFRACAASSGPMATADLVAEMPNWKHARALRRFGVQAAVTAPILSGAGQLLGVLALHYREGQAPRAEDQSLLTTASRLAAIAIEQKQLARRLAFQANHDEMTGLPNRLQLIERVEAAIARAGAGVVAVLFLDLDRFKQINEALGHRAGDHLLKKVGERLRGMLSAWDMVARMGGDEFAIVLSGLDSVETALAKPAEFIEAMRRPFVLDEREVFATASIGVSTYPRDGYDVETLLRNADLAMHKAKRQGKNDWQHFVVDTHAASFATLEVENALRHALENREFKLHYQPIVTMEGTLAGLEALLGWNHPTLGRISPGIFIPLAEEAGLIAEIGTWVLEQVCEQSASWRAAGLEPVRMAVNVSALQFGRPAFFEAVRRAMETNRIEPQWLDLELTESVVIRDLAASAREMARLREMGVRVSIDDFGTGYSSLSYLRQLPLDTLKIDQAFLRDLTADGGSLPVVQTIVTLAHNLSLEVIAEGVETREQLELLRTTGCDKVQGHLFGRPAPPEEIETILNRADRTMAPI